MKKKINYAEKDVLSEKDFERENIKERITIWIDESTLDAFRERAKEEGSKYQALINQALQEAIKKPSLLQRIERLEKKIG
jgi:predicted DNA binding CopG/RHH family protein